MSENKLKLPKELEGQDPLGLWGKNITGSEEQDPLGLWGKTDLGAAPPTPTPQEKTLPQWAAGAIAPYTPIIGATAGGILAAPANIIAPGVAEALGIGGGYLIGKEAERKLKEFAGEKETPETFLKSLQETGRDVHESAKVGVLGPIAGKGFQLAGRGLGRVAKEILGVTTGTGKGAIEEALHGGKAFTDAMRGKVSGEEIVQTAKDALQTMRTARGAEYVSKLSQIRTNPQALNQVRQGMNSELTSLSGPNNFNIGISMNPQGQLNINFSGSTLVKNQDVLKKAIGDTVTWRDNSAAGLDVLKKRISTYADQVERGSPAEAFLTRLEKSLNDGLKRAVPEYAEMTKGYSQATNLIKDIESNLMLRKEGMSGRITADHTLRRLTSALRENFEMRKDLMDALSSKAGDEISARVAGYAMNQILPRGGLGKLFAGSEIYAASLHPKILPVLATSSPRVVGEFLNVYGQAARSIGMAPAMAAKYGTVGAAPYLEKKGAEPIGREPVRPPLASFER